MNLNTRFVSFLRGLLGIFIAFFVKILRDICGVGISDPNLAQI